MTDHAPTGDNVPTDIQSPQGAGTEIKEDVDKDVHAVEAVEHENRTETGQTEKAVVPRTVRLKGKKGRFVLEYIRTRNATEAAKLAGYSEHTARRQGSRLLTNADVAQAIAVADQRICDGLKITRESLIERTRTIADCEIEDKVFPRDRLKAIELIAKLAGFLDAPAQVGPSFTLVMDFRDAPRQVVEVKP